MLSPESFGLALTLMAPFVPGLGGSGGAEEVGTPKSRPVIMVQISLTVLERQRMVRLMRAGRECQDMRMVPKTRMIRFVVIMRRGGRVRAHHRGEVSMMRIKRVVRAGCVVAEVAVCCVDKKSVKRSRGSSRILHRVVKVCRVDNISSNDLRCLIPSDGSLLCPFFFSPVQPVEDRGEYLLRYMPTIRMVTRINGPVYRKM